jgi:hypothetical protein
MELARKLDKKVREVYEQVRYMLAVPAKPLSVRFLYSSFSMGTVVWIYC